MSKQKLIEAIAATGVTKAEAEKAIGLVLGGITDLLVSGETVQLVGFGTFEPRKVDAREAHNPKTGGKVQVAAHIKPAFKAGKKLKDALNS